MTTRLWLTAGGLAIGVAILPGAALAQGAQSGSHGFKPLYEQKSTATKRDPAPPALPGAESAPDEASHAGETVDLAPTEALFDAINRGDMVEARDALSRGADLQSQNVLGMTPIALSVDLNRHDITFLLLSYHGAGSAPSKLAGSTATVAAVDKSGKPITPAKVATDRRANPTPTAKIASKPTRVLRASPTQTAVVPAGEAGTPIPQAGFLGFGG